MASAGEPARAHCQTALIRWLWQWPAGYTVDRYEVKSGVSVADWDSRFLEMARLVSTWSKDPSTQVGAVITRGKFVVSLGFNGHPKGVSDTPDRLENREVK